MKKYVRSCEICQRLAKCGERVKAPLINLPLIDEPWPRVAIDVVGPLNDR